MYYQHSQKKAAAADRNTKERDYWLNQLAGELTKAVFYYDNKNPDANRGKRDKITFQLRGDTFVRLSQLSRNSPHALHMIFVAALTLLLDKYTNLEDIIIGSPIYKQDIEGEFINTLLALRNRVEDNLSFKEFLVQVKDTVTAAVENQNYPIETLLYKLNMEPTANDFPLFDVLVLVENIHDKRYIQHINPNVIFSFLQTNEEVEGVVEYSPGLYEQTTIKRIIKHFTCLLQSVLANLEINLGSISILQEKEKKQLLFEFNDTKRAFERDRCYHQLFEEQTAKYPHRTAALHNDRQITYGELNGKSNQLAVLLREKGVIPDHLVAILCERSIEMLIGIMAVFKAGGAYIPFEADSPLPRIQLMIEDSGASILLTASTYARGPGILPFIEELCRHTNINQVIFPDRPGQIEKYKGVNPKTVNQPLDLSYVIYTSGTTGTPKGVMIHHQGMLNHIEAKINDLAITANDVIAQTASASFDISVWQFLAGLLTGGSIFIIDKEIVLDPERLLRIIQKGQITIWESVPSLMSAFLHILEYKIEKQRELNHLKWMILTGEALGVHLVKEWYGYYPGIKVLNAYGPTEAADDVTHYVVQNIPPADRGPANVPIGKPIQNTHIYILDRNLSLCPPGVRGEICTAGVGVGRGYWKDPGKTGRYFIPNPYADEIGDPGYAVLYKTGDIGYLGEDGNIHCLGRLDHQVKIRGYRIEPAEIENRLLKQTGISEAVVTVRTIFRSGEPAEGGQGVETGNKYLCAYFVTKPGSLVSAAELREYLAGELPGYMVPSYFVPMEKLPLTASGKIDREALPEPALEDGENYIAPANAIEKKLVDIWADILALEKDVISTNANFFEMGGHSLRATILTVKIHKEMDVKVPLIEIFQSTTIQALARYIGNASIEKFNPLNPVEKREYYALSSAQKRLYIIQQMDVNSIVYNMPMLVPLQRKIPGVRVDKEKLENTIHQLIHLHESFRTSFELIGEQPVQRIHRAGDMDFKIEILHLKEKNVEIGLAMEDISRDFVQPFRLSRAPLVRVVIVEIENSGYLLVVDMHHIISDGFSHGIVTGNFMALLMGEKLPPLRLQYKDYSGWQNSTKQKESIEKQKQYWLSRFAGEIPVLNMPLDYPRPPVKSFQGSEIRSELGGELTAKLKEFIYKIDITMYMVLIAAYSVLLMKYTGQEDILVGFPVSGRTNAELHQIIGLFANILVMRTNPHPGKTFQQFQEEVKQRAVEAFENQDYQFDELIETLDIPGNRNRHPLIDTVFAYQNAAGKETEAGNPVLDSIKDIPYRFHQKEIQHELLLDAEETPNNITLALQYSTVLYKESTARGMCGHYIEILEQVTQNPKITLKDIKISIDLAAMPVEDEKYEGDFVF